jgi:predicted transcriptional regulator
MRDDYDWQGVRKALSSGSLARSPAEDQYIELRRILARGVMFRRLDKNVTQARLAKLMGSSQSRVAKMEAADPSVSLDLLIRALFVLGASRRDLMKMLW